MTLAERFRGAVREVMSKDDAVMAHAWMLAVSYAFLPGDIDGAAIWEGYS